MSRLIHRLIPGATYFVTTDAWQKRSIFQVEEISEIIVKRLLHCRDEGAYQLHEFVLMPDHLHLLLTPLENISLERVMMLIKGGGSREIHLARQNSVAVWQSGFHESSIRDEHDYQQRRAYIQNNPFVAGLTDRFENWTFGSGNVDFVMDPKPAKFSSGAKARSTAGANVGAEAPTPAFRNPGIGGHQ